jgi:hypothetical protein
MPTREEHLAKEGRLAAFAASLAEAGSFPEWAIVATANRALHLVEAYFAATGTHNLSHLARNRAVRASLGSIAEQYVLLQNMSRIARYEADGALGQSDLDVALASFAIIEADLRPRL